MIFSVCQDAEAVLLTHDRIFVCAFAVMVSMAKAMMQDALFIADVVAINIIKISAGWASS